MKIHLYILIANKFKDLVAILVIEMKAQQHQQYV